VKKVIIFIFSPHLFVFSPHLFEVFDAGFEDTVAEIAGDVDIL